MKKIVCNVCGILIESDNVPMETGDIVIKIKYPKEKEIQICSEDCGIMFFKKRKIDIKAFKKEDTRI